MTYLPALVLLATFAAMTGCNSLPAVAPTQTWQADLRCGQLPLTVAATGEQVTLYVKGEQLELQQTISASGARYVADDEQETSLWFKGEQARLVLNGMEYPQCAPVGAIIEPFRASGNEPFWSLTLEQGMLSLNRLNEGQLPAQPYQFRASQGELKSQGDPVITVQLDNQLCRDDMSGMPYPQKVNVQLENTSLHGCGGDPGRLLQGAEWLVEDINDAGIIDRSRVTLNFWSDGRITGRTSCNNFMGQYQLTGEGLSISKVATTRMACAPSLMEQEQRVLANLNGMQSFDFDQTGALLLRSADGSLKARLDN